MKRILYYAVAVLLIVLGLGYFFFISRTAGEKVKVVGWVKYSSPSAQTITLERENGEEFTLALTEKTKLFNEKGLRTNFTYFSAGTKVEASGLKLELMPESLIAKEIRVTIPSELEL